MYQLSYERSHQKTLSVQRCMPLLTSSKERNRFFENKIYFSGASRISATGILNASLKEASRLRITRSQTETTLQGMGGCHESD